MPDDLLPFLLFAHLLFVVMLFCAWVWSELRRENRLSLALGVLCMLYFYVQMGGTRNVASRRVTLHASAIRLIEQRLDEGQERQVRRALQAYREAPYSGVRRETWDFEVAAIRMLTVLQEQESLSGEPGP